jgi:hypothetical protein
MKTEIRKQLFYKKYLYRASFKYKFARWITLSKTTQNFITNLNKYIGVNVTEGHDLTKVSNFIDFYHSKHDNICRVEGENVSIFGNDLDKLKEISETIATQVDYTQAIVYDFIVFKKYPKFKNRVYFKQQYLKKHELEKIKEFINLHVDKKLNAKASNSLQCLLYWHPTNNYSNYFHGSHYIDYNDESFLTLVYLWLDKYVGKNYKLVWIYEKDKYLNKTECLNGENN